MLKILKGELSISRPQFSDGRDVIHINLIDERAGSQAVEIHIGLADFAKALTGMGHVDCDFDFNDSGVVGTCHEWKEELVPIPDMLFRDDDKRISAILNPLEVDGWKARRSDLTNHHRQICKERQTFASVIFTRNVSCPPKEN